MPHDIKETDWKLFRDLHEVALNHFCEKVLGDLRMVISGPGKTYHERYLKAYKLLMERDKGMARLFDDLRRSTAIMQIALIRAQKLWSNDEFARFSPELQSRVSSLLEVISGDEREQ